jgi:hypothetical protein
MNTSSTRAPLAYTPSMEHAEDDEQQTIDDVIETMRGISETTFKDGGRGLRSVHAKSHGLVRARLRIVDGLPETLAQGLFAKAGEYDVLMRFSTSPGDVIDDRISTPRGMAMKIFGVDGPHVDGAEGTGTQDFVMANGPAFTAATAKAFARNAKLLASTTDKAEGMKRAFSTVLQGAEKLLEKLGGESPTMKSMGGHPETHILGETFYTQVPLLYGRYVAKLSLKPVSAGLKSKTDAKLDLDGKPFGIREAVREHFASEGGEWELRAQLLTDLEKMPIEDAATVWPEDESPFVVVARLTAEPQDTWPAQKAEGVEDRLSFSPWHALAEHRPLGSIMRVRKAVYEASAAQRAAFNSVSVAEPSSASQALSK